MKTIGKTIYETRKLKGYSQEELADMAKINLRTIQRIENEENQPRGKTLSLLCEVLQIDQEELNLAQNQNLFLKIASFIFNGIFLIILNVGLASFLTYLTYSEGSSQNSSVAALVLGFLIPYFIVSQTRNDSNLERLIKFGPGYIGLSILMLFEYSIPSAFNNGIILISLISLFTLYYGKNIFFRE